MNAPALLALGFALGMRHATDPDHVIAVATIVARERSVRAAAPIGMLWGLGHTLTILLVGSAILVFALVVPPRLGLSMELCVALMLVGLGGWNVAVVLRERGHVHDHESAPRVRAPAIGSVRPLLVGIVHGLAGSAAIALLVLATVRSALWGVVYLIIFGAGTILGMVLVTVAFALPIAASAHHFRQLHRMIAALTGVASIAFGAFLVYQLAIVDGIFSGHPHWVPQ